MVFVDFLSSFAFFCLFLVRNVCYCFQSSLEERESGAQPWEEGSQPVVERAAIKRRNERTVKWEACN